MTTQVKQPDLFSFGGINGVLPGADDIGIFLNPQGAEPVTPLPATTFFCRGHLADLPIDRQSENKDFCSQCWAIVKAERSREKDADSWDDDIFIHHGKRYIVAKLPKSKENLLELKTICLGAVKTQETAEKQGTSVADGVTNGTARKYKGVLQPVVTVTPGCCLFCNKKLDAVRKTRKFCSTICRVRYGRAKRTVTV